MSKIQFAFDVCLYGETQNFSPTLSKGRVRIFYKGLNRNRTYITDEFAEKLLSSLPYAPIVGKYEDGDFSDHGHGEQLQVYGVVPAEPNITWEVHKDYDGVERTYACADVLLWTARFPEAATIMSKSQSMEIWPKSVKGDWVYSNGVKYFKFIEGSFLGLTALGETVEPCFEGAAFYSLKESIDEFVKELNIYNKTNGGQEIMEFKFKLSDSQKENAIFNLINPNIDNGYVESVVCEVYSDYALCYNLYEGQYFRAYYTKDDETDTVEISNKADAYVLDLIQTEYDIVQRLRENSTSFAAIEEDLQAYSELKETSANAQAEFTSKEEEFESQKVEFENKKSELETQISELQGKIATYETEGQKSEEVKAEFEAKIAELNAELNTLKNYQLDNENRIKTEYLNKFAKKLPEQVVQELKNKIADFSTEDFRKEVSYEVTNANEGSLLDDKKQEFIPNGYSWEDSLDSLSAAEKLIARTIKRKS